MTRRPPPRHPSLLDLFRRSRGRKGVVAVEFALVITPFLILAMSVMVFARYFWIEHQLTYLCSQASHYVYNNSGKVSDWVTSVQTYLDQCVSAEQCNPYVNATPGIDSSTFGRTVTTSGANPTFVDITVKYTDFSDLDILYKLADLPAEGTAVITVRCRVPAY